MDKDKLGPRSDSQKPRPSWSCASGLPAGAQGAEVGYGGPRPVMSAILGYGCLTRSVSEPHHECQSDIETSDIAVVQAADRLPDPRPPDRHGLVGHDLRAGPQTIFLARLDRNAKIPRLGDFRRHLTNHN